MFRKLLTFFRPTPPMPAPAPAPAPSDETPLIHIHEDDWGMRNLYPLAALSETSADVAAAKASGDANFDGAGWTAMHMIEPPSASFSEAGLQASDVIAVLEPHLPKVSRFHATIMHYLGRDGGERDPYGSYEDAAVCFGFDARCFIKVDTDGELVRAIWFQWEDGEDQRFDALRDALLAINDLTPCVVADYWCDASGALSDAGFADRYFRHLRGEDG
ncbi:MAG: hypothetical protein HY859_18595 [Caulobacterales bacterium]|nr:hypothetical protein [Caulobacterales bacterium]